MRKIKPDKPPSELLLDLFLALFEQPLGSGELVDAVSRLRGHDVPLATFYRQLQRAVDRGWVEMDEKGPAGRTGPGRPERLYLLTAQGERALRLGMAQQQRRVRRADALGLLTERAP